MDETPMASSNEVFEWPEFLAFAKRLGVPVTKTCKLVIELKLGRMALVNHEYLGSDESSEANPQ